MEAVEAGSRPVVHEHEVTQTERKEEQMFLGLRKTDGISNEVFERKFNETIFDTYRKVIEGLVKDGLLESNEYGIRLTRKGRFVGNEVFQQFLLED